MISDKGLLSPNISIKDSFNNVSNCTFYLRKEDFNLNIEWAKKNIDISLKSVGNRYITYNNEEYKSLNQEVYLSNYLNEVKEITFSNFDDFINEFKSDNILVSLSNYLNNIKKFICDYNDLKSNFTEQNIYSLLVSENDFYTFMHNYPNYFDLSYEFYNDFVRLINELEIIKNDKNRIFNLDVIKIIKNLLSISRQKNGNHDVESIINKSSYESKNNSHLALNITRKIHESILYLYDTHLKKIISFYKNKEITIFDYTASNNFLSTFLFKYTLIIGEAMSGKTHLLSDIAKKRIEQNKPTILIYAQKFDKNLYDTPIQHSLRQLGLEKYQFTDDEFLELLNEWGKKSNELVFFIVDAVNETQNKNIWKNYFIEFISKIMRYPYISILMSVRDVEKKTIFTNDIQRFIKSNMMEIVHRGFEKIEYKVLKNFCYAFKINLPSFPFISPIFSNPGLLFLFFETLKRNNIHLIDEKVLKPNFIINEYIKDRNNHFKELYNISDRRTFIVKSTNEVSCKIVSNDFLEYVKYDDIYNNLFNIHESILDYLISEGILLENINQLEEILLYFSYQKFGNYFIAIYLLPDTFSETNILNKDILFKLFSNYEQYQAIVEALIIRLSENNKLDFIDIFPTLFLDENLNYIRYKCFSQSLVLPKTIENKINNILKLNSNEQSKILELLLKTSHEQSNNFNVQATLNPLLISLNLIHREYFWAIYINNSFINDGIVKVIVNWALDKETDFIIEYKSLFLYGLTLGWFLTSSNRELRDSTTKALVNIFTDNINCFLDVLKEFNNVNDLYITERLYAVAYGITLRSNNQGEYKKLGEYIYNSIFNVDNVIEHIMIRDYAKLTVEYIYSLIKLDIDINKVKPPYRSKIPSVLATDEEIDLYKNVNMYINNILNSMVTESGRSGNRRYGDFGRYTFQSNLRNFKLENLRIQDLSNYAVKIIIEEMIDDKELFSQAESNLRNISYSRHEHKVERIGKKYQWIAFYKILALVADNYKIIDRTSFDNITEKYKGTFQLSCRNIDPTSILRDQIESKYQWWLDINQNFECLELNDKEWMNSNKNLPKISDIVNISFENKNYLLMDTSFSVDGNKEKNKYRNLYYCINSFILKKENLETFISWANNQVFYAKKMPESNNFYSVFLREYPFSEAYDSINNYYYSQMGWETTFGDEENTLPCKVLLTTTSYMNEASGYDNSVNSAINIKLPNKWIIEKMNLKQSLNEGEWIDKNQNIIFLDKGANDEDKALLSNKEKLLEFLDNNGYTICWIMWGEKQERDTNDGFNEEEFLGISEISSFSYFNSTDIIDNKINIKYK